jgi:hypothetical protein
MFFAAIKYAICQLNNLEAMFDSLLIGDATALCGEKRFEHASSTGIYRILHFPFLCTSRFGGVRGNPPVFFDAENTPSNENVDLDGSAQPVMTEFFDGDTQIIQLTQNLGDEHCNNFASVTGLPDQVIVGVKTGADGAEHWIHTPSFEILSNELESPLSDGGKAAVDATADAPYDRYITRCSNAPRTFLNEDTCSLSTDACSVKAGADVDVGPVIVCGSPFEVANVHSVSSGTINRGGFDMATRYNKTSYDWELEEQRVSIWMETALKAQDQLRQRVAWALSQILVVSPGSIGQKPQTESFVTYYDIFVRNAFGNYFDILKEVTYSPMMSEMLSYLNGQSTGYEYITNNRLQYADENFAREVMQLFSIGLNKLNNDGTLQLDGDGHPIRSYTNKDITEYAKVYTGFRRQRTRGNIEDRTSQNSLDNQVDPMQISVDYRDHLPKVCGS